VRVCIIPRRGGRDRQSCRRFDSEGRRGLTRRPVALSRSGVRLRLRPSRPTRWLVRRIRKTGPRRRIRVFVVPTWRSVRRKYDPRSSGRCRARATRPFHSIQLHRPSVLVLVWFRPFIHRLVCCGGASFHLIAWFVEQTVVLSDAGGNACLSVPPGMGRAIRPGCGVKRFKRAQSGGGRSRSWFDFRIGRPGVRINRGCIGSAPFLWQVVVPSWRRGDGALFVQASRRLAEASIACGPVPGRTRFAPACGGKEKRKQSRCHGLHPRFQAMRGGKSESSSYRDDS